MALGTPQAVPHWTHATELSADSLGFWPSDHCSRLSQASPSCHIPTMKRFKVLRLNSKSLTLHTQWTVMILIWKPSNPIFVELFVERIRQITLFRVSPVPKQRTGIVKVSNTCMNLCNNMVEEKARVEKQNSKKGFEKNEHACIV